jgi:hypothetical protein
MSLNDPLIHLIQSFNRSIAETHSNTCSINKIALSIMSECTLNEVNVPLYTLKVIQCPLRLLTTGA